MRNEEHKVLTSIYYNVWMAIDFRVSKSRVHQYYVLGGLIYVNKQKSKFSINIFFVCECECNDGKVCEIFPQSSHFLAYTILTLTFHNSHFTTHTHTHWKCFYFPDTFGQCQLMDIFIVNSGFYVILNLYRFIYFVINFCYCCCHTLTALSILL